MSWIKKPWGNKQTIMETDHVIVDHLMILPGGFSSIHQHKFLHNRFYVLDPATKLEIQVFEVEQHQIEVTSIADGGHRRFVDGQKELNPNPVDHVLVTFENNSIAVPPKIWHRFRNPDEKNTIQIIEVSSLVSISIEDDIFRVPGFEKGGFSE